MCALTGQNHEIRTPLVGVLGMTDLLVLQKDLPQHLATQLRVIHESGNALLTLINNLLDVSKLDAGMMRLELRVWPGAIHRTGGTGIAHLSEHDRQECGVGCGRGTAG